MTLITLENVSRRFADLTVLEGASLQVEAGDRIGVVGENGSGKTTLLRIMAGRDRPEEGEVRRARGLRVVMADQIPSFPPGATVRQAALAGQTEVEALREELDALHQAMAGPEDPALLRRLERAQERYDALGGDSLAHRAEGLLCGLGFEAGDLDRPGETLSGGEKSRVQLAGVLLSQADLLLLDEPTNHLDLEGIQFLEGLLRRAGRTFLVGSHVRACLDSVAAEIVSVQDGQVRRWRGNFTDYARIRDQELERQFKEWERQREEIARHEDYFRRYHAGQRARQAKDRLKKLQRMEILRRPSRPRSSGPRIRWEAKGPAGGFEVVQLEGVDVAPAPEVVLLRCVEARVMAGERIGIVGRNGSGKTTLLRVVAGRLRPAAGAVFRNPKAVPAWFDQEVKGLVPGWTVLQTIRGVAGPRPDDGELRTYLALFLFSGDEVEKRVEELSGGEARRLLIATLTLEPAGLLCLDEPTNHLDIGARESLEEALGAFGGTVLFVSHDRYFLERVATQIWFLEPPRLRIFPGRWSEACRLKAEKDAAASPPPAARPREKPREKSREGRKVNLFKLERLEEKIFALEEELKEREASLGTPEVYKDPEQVRRVQGRMGEIREELGRLYQEWEEASGVE